MTPKNSSFSRASRVKFESGSETSGLKQIERRPLISPRWIASMISTAREPGLRDLVGRDAPDRGDVLASLGVGDRALARELVALLAVLAAALAVALAGDHHAARALAADVAGGERQVDDGEDVLDALRLVLDAARVQRHRAVRLAEPARGLLDRLGRHAGHLRRPPRIVGLDRRGDGVEAGRVRVDERAVLEAVAQDDVEDAHQERRGRCPGRTGR